MATACERCELAIVGSGRACLSVLSRLSRDRAERAVVIDPSGAWLYSFARTQLRLGATHLRSTTTQVPFENACGLERYIETLGKKRDVVRTGSGFAGVPSVRVFAEYCAKTVAERFGGVRVERGTVVDVRWCDETSEEVRDAFKAIDESEGAAGVGQDERDAVDMMRCGAILLTLDTGKTFLAARCVWTPKFSLPLVPSWVLEAKASYAKYNASYDRQSIDCGIMNAADVDMSATDCARGKCILVVGGGTTAATLALAAQTRGAKVVTLMCRRKITVSEFECDVKYFGNKGLYEFHACADAQIRANKLESFKSKASVNEHTHRRLRDAALKTDNLRVLEQRVLNGAVWSDREKKWRVRSAPTDEAKVEFESAMYRRYRDEGIEPDSSALAIFEKEVTSTHDEIWLACGEFVDLAKDPALRTLVETTSVEIARGFPALAEEKIECAHDKGQTAAAGGGGGCRWPGTSMYVLGAYASLTIGPGADLPVGHRMAAKQVVDAMKKHETAILRNKNPYQVAETSSEAQRTPDRGETFDRFKKLPPDLADKGLIDIESLIAGAAMERVELDNYEMYEEDMRAEIRLKIPEAILARDVYVCFQDRALEMWALGKQKAYRFFIRKLYKNVIVDRCSYRVYANKNRIVLNIHKYTNHYWRYLRDR